MEFRADGLFKVHRTAPFDQGSGEPRGYPQTIVCIAKKRAAGLWIWSKRRGFGTPVAGARFRTRGR